MSTGIDYSKWDKIVADMSSSDDDEDNHQQYVPPNDNMIYDEQLSTKHANVTRLKKPSSVTIGPKGLTINPTATKPTEPTKPVKSNKNTKITASNKPSPSKSNELSLHQKQSVIASKPSISRKLSSLLNKWSHNGGVHNFDYLWSQTADELIIRFLIPISARSKNVKIGFDVNKNVFSCNIKTNGNEWILNKQFSSKLKESTEEEAKLEWELCDVDVFNYDNKKLAKTMTDILCLNDDEKNEKYNNTFIEYANRLSQCRFLKITLEKERINNRVIEWWDHVFINDTKIDLKQRIKDRKTDANKMNDIWQKAHQQFKEKVANIEPQEIYVPDQENKNDDQTVTID